MFGASFNFKVHSSNIYILKVDAAGSTEIVAPISTLHGVISQKIGTFSLRVLRRQVGPDREEVT